MRKDYVVSCGVFIITVSLVFFITRDFFLQFAGDYKILGGFIKFFFLALIGDFIALRIKSKEWKCYTENGISNKGVQAGSVKNLTTHSIFEIKEEFFFSPLA